MKLIGVVCEYNPFHRGHLLQLESARAALGEDCATLCVMSGDFVQRGEGAVYDKFTRAEAACRCGADLVLELPLPWSLSSAEGFARGAVSLLGAMGASHLSFGSESGDTEALLQLSRTLADPSLTEEIRELMQREGSLSFAAARERAVERRMGDQAALLQSAGREPGTISPGGGTGPAPPRSCAEGCGPERAARGRSRRRLPRCFPGNGNRGEGLWNPVGWSLPC